jgi:hypothetical protein
MKTETIVMFDSPEAAKQVTVTGWVSRDGWFYGDDERIARYAGCTHRKCETCENTVIKGRIYCDSCTHKRTVARYDALPTKEWDGETPLCCFDDDRYFFDWESVEEYCEDNETTVEDLMLVICDPVKPRHFDTELFADYLPDDGEAPDEVVAALDVLNAAIDKAPPFSWYPGKVRPIFKETPKCFKCGRPCVQGNQGSWMCDCTSTPFDCRKG